MTTSTDNLDLQVRRKRLGLRQRDVARMLGVGGTSAISSFENGDSLSLPHGQGRKEYERVLTEAERQQKRAVK